MNLYFSIINEGYVPFALNFLKRLDQIDFKESFLLICTDKNSYEEIKKNYKNCILKECVVSNKFETWGTTDYKNIVFNKLDIKKYVIKKYRNKYENIIYIDTDIWININFSKDLNLILKNSKYDIVFQDGEDYLFDKEECCLIENNKLIYQKWCNSYCTGFMIMNSKFINKISQILTYSEEDKNDFEGNQEFINQKLYYYNLKLLCIPKTIFPNYSLPKFYKNKNFWMLHYTFLVGKEKIKEMKKNKHWII